jgi:hypothetical protein
MARKRKDICRICGDTSATDADTWQPTGLCAAHSRSDVREARKARRAARRADREVVVIREPSTRCDVCGGLSPRAGYRHDACADIVERGQDWPANA